MPIQIRMAGDEADEELASFYRWLREDDDVRRHSNISMVGAEPSFSEMGSTTLQVIQLAVGSGFQTLSLAMAYISWRTSRSSRHTQAQVMIETEDGRKLTLTGADAETVNAVARALR